MLNRFLPGWRYARFKPFDTSTEEGRSDERYRLALWSVLSNIIGKGISMLVMVLSISWTLPYLGTERLGVWMTLASFVGMLLFMDLGIGNALTNRVARAAANGSLPDVKRAISGGLGLLLLVSVVAVAALCLAIELLPWTDLIKNAGPEIQEETQRSLLLLALLFGVSLVNTGIQRVFAGLQRSFEANVATSIASIFSLCLLWIAAHQRAGIPWLLLVTQGCQSIAGLVMLAFLAKRGLFSLRGIRSAFASEKTTLLKSGGLFFVLQIGTMVGWGADNLIIASALGASQVAVYVLAQRLFQFVSQPLAVINTPLWSAYADAHVRGDRQFISRTLRKSMLLSFLVSVAGGGLLLLGSQEIFAWWTKGLIVVPFPLIVAFFIWTICETLGNAFAMVLNGCGIVRAQVITVMTLTAVAIPAKMVAVHWWGIEGMITSYIGIFTAVVVGFYGFAFRTELIEKMGIR